MSPLRGSKPKKGVRFVVAQFLGLTPQAIRFRRSAAGKGAPSARCGTSLCATEKGKNHVVVRAPASPTFHHPSAAPPHDFARQFPPKPTAVATRDPAPDLTGLAS